MGGGNDDPGSGRRKVGGTGATGEGREGSAGPAAPVAATTSQEKLNGGPEVESHNKQESDTGAAMKYFLLTMKYFSGREIIFSLRSDISPRMKTNLICGLYIFSGASVIDIMLRLTFMHYCLCKILMVQS